MEPGFANLQKISEGQLLARDRTGAIRSTERGLILLPLYQDQGNDGFFWCREVRRLWLSVSALFRRLRLGSMMHLLPGVKKDPDQPETLVINTRIARFYPLELFHLMGFRKRRQVGATLVVSRRPFDPQRRARRAAPSRP